jgi:mercuric ion transport protein
MDHKLCVRTGVAGTVIAAVCCFTPLLVVAFGALGVSAWLGWIDLVLLPALALFVALTVYGLYLRSKTAAQAAGALEGE